MTKTSDCIQAIYDYADGKIPYVNQVNFFSGWQFLKILFLALVLGIGGFLGGIYLLDFLNVDNIFLIAGIVFGPIILGIGIGLSSLQRRINDTIVIGCRRISTHSIGLAFQFLDMLANGFVEVGTLENDEVQKYPPGNYLLEKNIVLFSRLATIRKIAPGEAKHWWPLVVAQLKQVAKARDYLMGGLILIVIVGAVAFQVGLVIAHILMIPLDIYTVIIATIILFSLLGIVMVLVFLSRRNRSKDEQKAVMVIDTPQIRYSTGRVIEEFLDTLAEELKCPVQCLLIGSYRNVYRSGVEVTTNRGVTLYESFILPAGMPPLEGWIEGNSEDPDV